MRSVSAAVPPDEQSMSRWMRAGGPATALAVAVGAVGQPPPHSEATAPCVRTYPPERTLTGS